MRIPWRCMGRKGHREIKNQKKETTKGTKGHEGIAKSPSCAFVSFVVKFLFALWQPLRQARQGLYQIVVDHHYREQYQEDERCLVDALFDAQAYVAADQAFNQQQQDYSSIENRNWQQVEDAEVEADGSSNLQQRHPALLAGGAAHS